MHQNGASELPNNSLGLDIYLRLTSQDVVQPFLLKAIIEYCTDERKTSSSHSVSGLIKKQNCIELTPRTCFSTPSSLHPYNHPVLKQNSTRMSLTYGSFPKIAPLPYIENNFISKHSPNPHLPLTIRPTHIPNGTISIPSRPRRVRTHHRAIRSRPAGDTWRNLQGSRAPHARGRTIDSVKERAAAIIIAECKADAFSIDAATVEADAQLRRNFGDGRRRRLPTGEGGVRPDG